MRRATVPAVLGVAALALAACGGSTSGGSGLPTIGSSPSTSAPAATTAPTSSAPVASATPATDPSPWTALPTIPTGPNKGLNNGIVLASSAAAGPDEQAAVDLYIGYWTFLLKAGNNAKASKAQIAEVASSTAADALSNYVADLSRRNRRTVGWASVNVTDVFIKDGITLIDACIDNGSYDINATSGKAVEKPPVGYDAKAAIQAVKGRQVVTSSVTRTRSKPC